MTNSPAIALGLTSPAIHVIVAPGELDQHMRVLTGRWTIDFLAGLNFAAAFVSAAGITLDHGLTTSRSGLADTLNAAADSAERVVGLMDSTKFERASLMTIRSATELDLIITDDRLDPEVVDGVPRGGSEPAGRVGRGRGERRGGRLGRPCPAPAQDHPPHAERRRQAESQRCDWNRVRPGTRERRRGAIESS